MDKHSIETANMILRPPELSDALAIYRNYAGDPDVTRYLLWTAHESELQTRRYIRQCEEDWHMDEMYTWGIVLKQTSECIGMVGLKVRIPKAELGYVLSKTYWNRGIMTEAVSALCDYALQLDQIYRVWATCHVDNIASKRVLEKVNMQLEGTLRSWAIFPALSNQPQDCFVYARTSV